MVRSAFANVLTLLDTYEVRPHLCFLSGRLRSPPHRRLPHLLGLSLRSEVHQGWHHGRGDHHQHRQQIVFLSFSLHVPHICRVCVARLCLLCLSLFYLASPGGHKTRGNWWKTSLQFLDAPAITICAKVLNKKLPVNTAIKLSNQRKQSVDTVKTPPKILKTLFQDSTGNYWKDNQPSNGFDHLQKNCNGSETVKDVLDCINNKTFSLDESIKGFLSLLIIYNPHIQYYLLSALRDALPRQ